MDVPVQTIDDQVVTIAPEDFLKIDNSSFVIDLEDQLLPNTLKRPGGRVTYEKLILG